MGVAAESYERSATKDMLQKAHVPGILKYWVCVQRGQSTSWGEGASLALVGHASSDGITIKMPYGVNLLHRPASHPIFSYWVG